MIYMTKYEIFRNNSSQLCSWLDSWQSIIQQRCSESFAEWVALEDCVGAFWVHGALALEHLVDLASSNRRIYMVLIIGLALKISMHMLALLERSWTICWDAIVGRRAISLNLLTLRFPWDDHIARIMPNVDHVAEIAVGVVIVVALLFLATVGDTLAPEHPLLIA